MAIQQPQSTDKLNSPDHALSHRVFANDDAAQAETVVALSTGDVKMGQTSQGATSYKFMTHNAVYSLPDNQYVSIFSISLPTQDTGAVIHLSFTYVVTNGTSTGVHGGIYICAIVNQNGTVTGSIVDSGESTAGTGAGANVDAQQFSIVGTTATFQVKFNNTLSATGSFMCQVLNNSAANFTWL